MALICGSWIIKKAKRKSQMDTPQGPILCGLKGALQEKCKHGGHSH